jgi:hypothetical protein
VFSRHHWAASEPIRMPIIWAAATSWDNMRATGTFRAQKPPAAGLFAGDVRRAFLACGLVLALCIVAAVIGSWSQASSPAAQSRASNENNLSTGSMLVVSPNGNLCRERVINNATWQIRDKGAVDCVEALTKAAISSAEGRSGGSRIDIIRESFRGKP